MHELRNQHVRFCWLFLDYYGVKTIVFCVRSRPKKTENKNIHQRTLSGLKTFHSINYSEATPEEELSVCETNLTYRGAYIKKVFFKLILLMEPAI